jgi:hypothetical protein
MTDINVIQTSDGYAKIRLHDFEAMQAEAERLREEVRELKRKLKNCKHAARYCPICSGEHAREYRPKDGKE